MKHPACFLLADRLSDDRALLHEESFRLDYASDCRGREPFLPVVAGRTLMTAQVPATLPTLDEALGDTHDQAFDYFEGAIEEASRAEGALPACRLVHAPVRGRHGVVAMQA